MDVENTKQGEFFTEEMAEQVAKELGLSAEENETIAKIREILNGNGVVGDEEEISPSTVLAEDYDSDLFAEVEKESQKVDLIDIAINGIESDTIKIDDILERSKEVLSDVSEDDIMQMLKVAQRYRKGEDFSVFKELPAAVQATIRKEAGVMDRATLNLFAKMAIEEFCTEVIDVTLEKETIDFNESLQKALQIPDITQLYEGYVRDRMEKELITKAEALEAAGYYDGAKVLRGCSEAFTDSYTFSRMRAALTGKTRRKLYKDNEFYNRYCNEFNSKIAGSKFKITDIYELGRVLDKLAPIIGISNDDVLMFVILFCKTCQNYDANETTNGIFMYYTIRNILNMEHHSLLPPVSKEPDEFDQTIINNIASLVNDIHVIVNERSNK